MDSGATRNRAERAEPHSTLPSPAERTALVISGALLLASLAFTVHPWYEARPDASLGGVLSGLEIASWDNIGKAAAPPVAASESKSEGSKRWSAMGSLLEGS